MSDGNRITQQNIFYTFCFLDKEVRETDRLRLTPLDTGVGKRQVGGEFCVQGKTQPLLGARKSGPDSKYAAFSLKSIGGIHKSGARGFWCGCTLYVICYILLYKVIWHNTGMRRHLSVRTVGREEKDGGSMS